jgi:hypothetical protein
MKDVIGGSIRLLRSKVSRLTGETPTLYSTNICCPDNQFSVPSS